MKGTDHFKRTIQMYLEQRAEEDTLDFRDYGMDRAQLWDFMCHKARVATDDGAKFGPNGEGDGFQRLNFACPRQQLTQALERIAQALDQL